MENKLQSPVGQLKTQRGNLLIPIAAKDATKDAKDERDSTKEQDEPRDSSTAIPEVGEGSEARDSVHVLC